MTNKIHPDGTIFSTGPGGVLIIGQDGTHLGTIKTVERTANCTFDSNYEYLYMTTDMYLTRVKLKKDYFLLKILKSHLSFHSSSTSLLSFTFIGNQT